jgi:glycosyltransferase involved in cell wall biosynthesis
MSSNLVDGISVLMPVLVRGTENRKAYTLFERAISSIVNQNKLPKIEIVIIDDGSSVELSSLGFIKALKKDADIKILRNHTNMGIAYSLNKGILKSKYHWIARLDADDVWRPEKISCQLDYLESNGNCTLLGTSVKLCFVDSRREEDNIRPEGWKNVLRYVGEKGCPFAHGSILGKKDIFMKLGGYPQDSLYAHCEDFALWFKWVRFFEVSNLKAILLEYTISETSVSSQNKESQDRGKRYLHHKFREMGNLEKVPEIIAELAALARSDVNRVGVALYRLWRDYELILVSDKKLRDLLSLIMPDRHFFVADECAPPITGKFSPRISLDYFI